MVTPNPRLTAENHVKYKPTAEKNCSKLFLNTGNLDFEPDDYCYNSQNSEYNY